MCGPVAFVPVPQATTEPFQKKRNSVKTSKSFIGVYFFLCSSVYTFYAGGFLFFLSRRKKQNKKQRFLQFFWKKVYTDGCLFQVYTDGCPRESLLQTKKNTDGQSLRYRDFQDDQASVETGQGAVGKQGKHWKSMFLQLHLRLPWFASAFGRCEQMHTRCCPTRIGVVPDFGYLQKNATGVGVYFPSAQRRTRQRSKR